MRRQRGEHRGRPSAVRSWVHRASGVTVIATTTLLVLGLLAPAASSQSAEEPAGDRPLLFQGQASTAGVHLYLNTEPRLLPLEDFIRGEAPYGYSMWSSVGQAVARAASYYPGTSGTGGPGLLCTFGFPCAQFPQPFPPPYPLMAQAQYPTQPDDQTQDGIARAHAGEDRVETFASMSNNAHGNPIAPLAPVLDIGSVESHTVQHFVDGAFEVRAESHLQDVVIAGGAIRIESIDAVSVSRADAESPATTEARYTVQGATFNGTPIRISNEGVTIADQGGGGEQRRQAQEQLNAFLEQHQAQIQVIDASASEDGSKKATSEAQGLLISMRIPVENPTGEDLPSVPLPPQAPIPGNPNMVFRTYLVTMVLGTAGTEAFASNDPFDAGIIGGGVLPPPAAPTAPAPPPTTTGGFDTAASPSVPSGSSFASSSPASAPQVATGDAGPSPDVAPPTSNAPQGIAGQLLALLGFEGDLAHDLPIIYLVLCALGLVLFSMTRVPAVASHPPDRAA